MRTKLFAIAVALLTSTVLLAQDNRRYKQRDKDESETSPSIPNNRVFLGGSLGLGASSNSFNIGASPEVGYTLESWLDVGMILNFNYTNQSADPYYNNNIRLRAFNYGGGPFMRLYPLDFLFLYGGIEQNWIKYSEKDMYTGLSGSTTVNALSVIGGIGYAQRVVGSMNYYIMAGMDFRNDRYSPYRNYNNSVIPILRAGFNIYLK